MKLSLYHIHTNYCRIEHSEMILGPFNKLKFWGSTPYQQFTDRGEEEEDESSIPAPWTNTDKEGLMALTNAPIKMADTSYGRFLATQKRDAERAFQHMDAAEREAFLRRLVEIDAANAKDGQSPPSYLTPV